MQEAHSHIIGKKLDFQEWERFQEKQPFVFNGVARADFSKERYKRTIDGEVYSMGVYYLNDKLTVVAYGPIGSCIGHAFVNEDNSFRDIQDGCIDFSAILDK